MVNKKYSLAISTSQNLSLGIFSESILVKQVLHENLKYTAADISIPYIQNLFEVTNIKLQNLRFIAINIGPGFFTGLRLGVTIAKTLQLAIQIPAIGCRASKVLAYESMCLYKGTLTYIITLTNVGKSGLIVSILDTNLAYVLEDTYFSIEDFNIVETYMQKEGTTIVCGEGQSLFASNVTNIKYIYVQTVDKINLSAMNTLALLEYESNKNLQKLEVVYGSGIELNKFS